MKKDSIYKILSIDGGGIRGVVPAHILSRISKKLGIDIADHFDMIAGTSTGAIIAAGIACGKAPEQFVSLYKENGPNIFTGVKSLWPEILKPMLHSRYCNKPLGELLKDILGDIRLGDINKPLILPATDIGQGRVHVFKSCYSKEFIRDPEVLVRDAVLASCAAPSYFDPARVSEYLLADGGLWANNPSLVAVIDAHYRLNIPFENINILSLGTGHARTYYGVNANKAWGLIRGWKGPAFIDMILSLQSQSIHNYLLLLLKKEQVLRLDFESDKPLPLDQCSAIDDLISNADTIFSYQFKEIKGFLNLEKGDK